MISGETVEKGHFEGGLFLRVVFFIFEIIHLLMSKSMVSVSTSPVRMMVDIPF